MNHQFTTEIQKPFYSLPSQQIAHIIICYRNFMSKSPNYSHTGLGVNALHTAKCLRAIGIHIDIIPIWDSTDLINLIKKSPTHIIIEAPFISATSLQPILNSNPNINFVCRTHSQIGFLQVEAGAIQLIRDYLRLQDQNLNFFMSVNSPRLGTFIQQVYNSRVLLLPNLYHLDPVSYRNWNPPDKLLRIGSFGAIRIQKNHTTSAAAALILASLHKKDLEFYISVHREEHGKSVVQALRNMYDRVPYAKLIEVPWSQWSDFRRIIANLDLHMQMSVSESFNICTADAVSEGIPSIVSECIEWMPRNCVAEVDDANNIATKAWEILNSPHAAAKSLAALRSHNGASLTKWTQWLNGSNNTMPDFHLM